MANREHIGGYPKPGKRRKARKRRIKPVATRRKNDTDKIWAAVIKARAGNKCERCGKTDNLNAHHLNHKKGYRLRYSLRNGICLCADCHINKAHSLYPVVAIAFFEWVKTYRGPGIWNDLELLRVDRTKTNIANVILFLQNELRKYENR